MLIRTIFRARAGGAALALLAAAACGGSDSTGPSNSSDTIILTSSVLHSLDSSAVIIKQSNPSDPTLQALVDSTLLTLTAGVQARRIAVTSSLTSAPLYFVAVHRVFTSGSGAWQTWSLVGFDDPAHLTTLVEASGYAPTATPPASTMTGAIGDGTGIANGLMLRVATGGAVTQWTANSGSMTFHNGTPGAACPGFTATPHVTCALETLQAGFALAAASGTGGAAGQTTRVDVVQDVPGIRLTYTP